MIITECPKCKTELTQYDGYGVCPECGEIVGFDIEDETEVVEETKEEIYTEENVPEEVAAEDVPPVAYIEPEAEETEEATETVTEEFSEEKEETTEETVEEAVVEEEPEIPEEKIEEKEEIKAPKKKKGLIITVIVLILCALAVSGGYFATKIYPGMTADTAEEMLPEDDTEKIVEEEPKAIEEPEEVPVAEEQEKQEETPAPVKTETPKKPTVKKEDAVITPTPSISYRIRKSADDSETQIGAFSDIEKAKAFAASHSADGYKVFDMNGQLVFEP